MNRQKKRTFLVAFLLTIIFLLISGLLLSRYWLYFLTEVLVWSLLAISFDLLFGYTGLLSFGQAMFFGLGAYGVVLSVTRLHVGVLLMFVSALILSIVFAWLSGRILARLKNHYFVIMTVVLSLVLFSLADSWKTVTGGNDGLSFELPQRLIINLPWLPFSLLSNFYFVVLICALLFWLCWKHVHSEQGLVYQAIKSNEFLAESIGYNPRLFKQRVFTIAGILAGISGALYALISRYVSSDFLHWTLSGEAIMWTILGGKGTLIGSVLGTAIFFSLKDQLSSILGSNANLYPIFMGVALIGVMRFMPQGIVGLLQAKIARFYHVPPLEKVEWLLEAKSEEEYEQILQVRGIGKTFGGVAALQDVTLSMHSSNDAESMDDSQRTLPTCLPQSANMSTGISIIGANAAGKTTLMNVITGHTQPDGGEIYFKNKPLFLAANNKRYKPYESSLMGIARTFQQISLFWDLTAYDNVRVAALSRKDKLSKITDRGADTRIHKKVAGIFTAVGLTEHAWKKAASLSCGQQRLLQIGIALATDPDLLLLDEPASGVSPKELSKIVEFLRQLSGRTALLVVEHNLDVVRDLGFETYVMSEGRIVAQGKPVEVLGSDETLRAFLGDYT